MADLRHVVFTGGSKTISVLDKLEPGKNSSWLSFEKLEPMLLGTCKLHPGTIALHSCADEQNWVASISYHSVYLVV